MRAVGLHTHVFTCVHGGCLAYSVREFCELAFARIGIILEWRGVGVSEVGVCKTTGQTRVLVDPRYFRPTEVRFSIMSLPLVHAACFA